MKDGIEKMQENNVLYKIGCADCKEIYVGHTEAGIKIECIITDKL